MLKSLYIKNIILIKSIEISFSGGLCIFTGETGAGKSILLDALGLILGNKSNTNLIRHGETQATVTAVFKPNKIINNILNELDIYYEDELIIRRIIYDNGKNKSFINDEPVSNNTLKKLAPYLVEIHGQHDQRFLLNPVEHIKMLDEYGKVDTKPLEEIYIKWTGYKKELEELQAKIEEAKKEEEYLSYALEELNNLAPEANEEEALQEKRIALKNSGKEIGYIKKSLEVLGDSNSFRTAQSILIKLNNGKFSEAIEQLEKTAIEAEEASIMLERLLSDCEYNPYSLEEIEDRLFALKDVARKYRVTVDELSDYRDKVEASLKLINKSEENLVELENTAKQAYAEYLSLAEKISEKRKKAALKLEKAMHKELPSIKMENTRVKVNVAESSPTKNGIDKVEFLVSTNKGMPLAQLAKIASGGEISRFSLVLKVVLSANDDKFHTLIFDEIDTGIGGATASAVGKRLSLLANNSQVLVVTHQPQVASFANQHFVISKQNSVTTLNELTNDEQREELARMLSGANITDEARKAAESLLNISKK